MIEDLSLSQMIEGLSKKEFSSEELTNSFLKKINAVNPLLNAVVQQDPEFSLHQARQADNDRSQGKLRSPIQGIPFTAKDWLETKDLISAAGMEERRTYKPKEDATVIKRLYQAGAILLGKTNVPYELGETNNRLYGRTNNPYNLEYTPGGSSGGEASILAAGASGFGIGEDSGGSIRIPCHNCGIAGLKPTTGRVPNTGHFPKIGGFIDPRSQIGPMARYVEDLRIIFPYLYGSNGIDPYVIDMPYKPSPSIEKMTIGYYTTHADIKASAETESLIESCADFLRQIGAVVQLDTPKLENVERITCGYWDLYKNPPNEKEYLKLLEDWDNFKVYMMQYAARYDALIMPVDAHPAKPHIQVGPINIPYYTLTFSLLGWPCSTVRVGTSENGLPINVQIAAKPFQEDTCLTIAAYLEKLCGWKEPYL